MMEQTYDVTIVGGGPAGMFAAFYAGLHELKAQLIESLPQLGGQVAALYPEKQIWDVAGEAGVQGRELIAKLEKQMAIAPIDQFLGEQVTNVVKLADGTFKIESAQRTSYSKAVVIALGNGAFSPRRLALDGAAELEGQQVRYFVNNQTDFTDQRVAVLGGGDSAIDMALMLEPVAKEVHLIHRRDSFRALEYTVTQLKNSTVQVQTPYLPKDLRLNVDDSVELTLKKMRSDEEKHLEVDKILVNYGFTSNNAALNEWELPLASERGLIKVDSKMETSVPGVYAIGDGVTYPGKAALIAVGFGEAPIAITALAKELYPKKRMATHSSSMHIKSQND
ncbi:NAD(P)/FAD-dependent oxidoreductase [Limosilactobacillus mucosae]|uniref:NAD(P)/FAD-dependent oxidoreductase n=1 Tax=Limosilactobacillus mucosae TaxID=97478 RepID=UPI0025A43D02|nr:NAD(P)/FAD-dependent oxidoreductase [Limosilactobacillus mucosae]MDM8219199.1 NAD(P)/FAD-dependent oxidoreductase [Limosilactobacillus mucosae]MDM8313855.1 NAD(P)/FAD-dependent oxidoreductase [Limosilactobacillus mucosae]